MSKPTIILKDLVLSYPLSRKERRTLHDPRVRNNQLEVIQLDYLEFKPGRIHSLVGCNGSGKTTLMKAIVGLHLPQCGDVFTYTPNGTKPTFGYASGYGKLYPNQTVKENLEYFAKLNRSSMDTDFCREILSWLEVDRYLDKPANSLSAGMQQKVLLLRALIHNPDIVVLDEPTTGVDLDGNQAVYHLLVLLRQAQKTILLSTHQSHEIQNLSDRVVAISGGKVVFNGLPTQIAHPGERFDEGLHRIIKPHPTRTARNVIPFNVQPLSQKNVG